MVKNSFSTSLDAGGNIAFGVREYNYLLPLLKTFGKGPNHDSSSKLKTHKAIPSSESCHFCGDARSKKVFCVYYCDETHQFSSFILCTSCMPALMAVNPTAFNNGRRSLKFLLLTSDRKHETKVELYQPNFEKQEPLLLRSYVKDMLAGHSKKWHEWFLEENHLTRDVTRLDFFNSFLSSKSSISTIRRSLKKYRHQNSGYLLPITLVE